MRDWKPLKKHPGVFSYSTMKGTRYGARRRYKPLMGGPLRQWSKSGFLNWRDADMALKRFEVKLTDGTIAAADQKHIKLNQYFDHMAARKSKLGIWKVSTSKNCRNYYNHYFRNTFGDDLIQDVSRIKYQQFIDSLVEQNFAKTTIRTINSIMQQIMNDAESNDVINKNKLRHIEIAGGKEPKDQSLDRQDYQKFIAYAKTHETQYMFALIYFLSLGERRQELMGLRRSSFTFKHDDINNRQVCAVKFDMGRTPDELDGGTLKNKSSYRTIWVTGDFVNMIKYVITYSDNILANLNQPIDKDHFVWLNSQTGKPLHPTYPNRVMRRVSKGCGVAVHPHQLRHYFATKAKSDGLPDMDVMHWLGHANIQMTNSYTRETPEGALNVFKGISKDI
ncbi:tyrosine-type recombinase/integrase [Lentilactobacillus parabuchneri]|uniref:tyrosine-type recombinase/integrase n=1 Tax=Lentilactobacillus parabuchneri TaxID=152331 RepID=UPI002235F459|nr:tyrosine-type recombinase/integrase [Lentilactobacillus parabuchneri]MCW4398061.1 tyrosine-type recombinase/integrase [Lentilactobacillus parabuchneri]